MIIVPIMLNSAIDGRVEILGTLVVDNIGGTHDRGDYRVRMYRKETDGRFPETAKLLRGKPIREGRVLGHRRLAEPVGNLIAKAMKELGYG
ncbi:MAG: hypothetical protein R3E02_09935 [Blastomonas sp.]